MAKIEDNTSYFIQMLRDANARALEKIGAKIEAYAIQLCPRGYGGGGGALYQSIHHQVEDMQLIVGSNVQYAPYVELGTGNLYDPPPEYIEQHGVKGRGMSSWIYYDFHDREFHVGVPQPPRPFLRPAFENHLDEYEQTVKREMGGG